MRSTLTFMWKVTVGSLELSANKDIRQVIEIVEDYGKYRVLVKHLQVPVVVVVFVVVVVAAAAAAAAAVVLSAN